MRQFWFSALSVETPHVFRCEVADEVTEALEVDSTDLLDELAPDSAPDVDLGP